MVDKPLDFMAKRKETIENKRRNFERLLFNNLLGAYSVVDQAGTIYPVSLVDISPDGCLFQVPWNRKTDKKIDKDHETTLRMYFTKKSFVPVVVNVKYGNEYIDDNGHVFMRYGCIFDKSLPSFDAMKSFIDFLYKFAEHSAIDRGDNKAFFL